MRLSDAVLAGSLLGGMKANDINHCALGAAGDAVGIKKQRRDALRPYRYYKILGTWPWLEANEEERGLEIMELFDHHVCTGKMTLEMLVEYIRKIEPPCGECCSFDCCCSRVEELEARLTAELRSSLPTATLPSSQLASRSS